MYYTTTARRPHNFENFLCQWKSCTITKSYIEDTLCSKMAIAEKIQVLPKDRKVVGLSSSSETPNQVESKTADQNKMVFDINVNVISFFYCNSDYRIKLVNYRKVKAE